MLHFFTHLSENDGIFYTKFILYEMEGSDFIVTIMPQTI